MERRQQFTQGQDYTSAAHMFQEYLKNEAERRHPQALAQSGEALLATGQLDQALEMLKECIDLYPRDAAACRARLLAARAYEEKRRFAQKPKTSCPIISRAIISPGQQGIAHSLLVLGELLAERGSCTMRSSASKNMSNDIRICPMPSKPVTWRRTAIINWPSKSGTNSKITI